MENESSAHRQKEGGEEEVRLSSTPNAEEDDETVSRSINSCSRKKKLLILIMLLATIAGTMVGLFQIFDLTVSYPWHASCEINWVIPEPCSSVRSKLTSQIEAWTSNECPGVSDACPEMPCGQRCKYQLNNGRDTKLRASHFTPVANYEDLLTFTFGEENENSCNLEGYSTSKTWYAYLDWGTNYCNLRNLLDGAALSASDGFTESTSTSVCTQFDKINCERY